MNHAPSMDRRGLLKLMGTGLSLSIGSAGLVSTAFAADEPKKFGGDTMPGGTVDNPLVFVSIATDGTVTLVAHRVEMGTGIRTSLPMVVADEMEADWARVKVVQAVADETKYGNQNVDGSRSIRHFLAPMRRVGASARQMLEAAAAARWQVPVQDVKAANHAVVHAATGRRLGYGELAEAAAQQPVPDAKALRLKKAGEFRYIGKGKVLPVDGRDISTGRAQYGADVRLPGMLYAVVARPPVLGGRLKNVDSSAAMQVDGVVKIVTIPTPDGPPSFSPLGGVAVVARNTWAAIKGREALKIEWDDGPNAGYDSAGFEKTLQASAAQPGTAVRNTGDAMASLAAAPAAQRLDREYYLPHLAHAAMEPPVATVRIVDGKAECWAPVQSPAAGVGMIAAVTGLKPDQITLHPTLLGGAFGRKSKPDYIAEAAFVCKAMDGAPVKLQWTREDDLRHDYFHYVSVQRLQAVLTPDGRVDSWLHRSAQPTIISTFAPGAKTQANFEFGMTAITVPWQVPHLRVETCDAPAHTRIGWFRSVANIPHAFAAQSFIGELAHAARRDPKEFLLELIGPARKIDNSEVSDAWNYTEDPQLYPIDTGRFRRVIEEATRRAAWGRKLPKGRGLGLAVAHSFTTYVAAVVEVEVNAKGEVTIPRVDVAIDCGPAVNPERVRAQVEGGAVMGLGIALSNEISFSQGRTVQTNFHEYLVSRNHEAPRQIRVWPVGADDFSVPPGGVGEPPVPPMAPALCNAIFAATGQRIRRLPIGDQLAKKA